MVNKLILSVVVLLVAVSAETYWWTELGQFGVSHPAFFLHDEFYINDEMEPTLFVTSFTGNPLGSGKIYRIEDLEAVEDYEEFKPISLGLNFAWPNILSMAPMSVTGGETVLMVGDGFLVPGKSTGGVYAITLSGKQWSKHELSHKRSGWFYHNVSWVDMNGDGNLDILTARAYVPTIGSPKGQLLWLENPGTDSPFTSSWNEHIITDGPDVIAIPAELDGDDSTLEVLAAQFFTDELVLYSINLEDQSVAWSRVIDNTIGPIESVGLFDINNDGDIDIYVNNHVDDAAASGIYAYQIPDDIQNGEYERHLLATGFKITERGSNQGAPGFAYPFYPKIANTDKERPHILVAGDGTQSAILLRPNDDEWTFTSEEVIKTKGMVGSILIKDIDNDGYSDFLVPCYDKNYVAAFTFTPQDEAIE